MKRDTGATKNDDLLVTQEQLDTWMRWFVEDATEHVHAGKSSHPSHNELAAYVERRLPDEASEEVTFHLAGCPACSEREDALLRERLWDVVIIASSEKVLEVRTADQTWKRNGQSRVEMTGWGEELSGLSSAPEAFWARRRQGDVDVMLRVADGHDDSVQVNVRLLKVVGTPAAGVGVRLEKEDDLLDVTVLEGATDAEGGVALTLPHGDYQLQLGTSPPLTVLLSVWSPDAEQGREKILATGGTKEGRQTYR